MHTKCTRGCGTAVACGGCELGCWAAGKQIKGIREKFGMPGAEVNTEQCALLVTCSEEELPRAEALIEHVREFVKGVEVGRTYPQCAVCDSPDHSCCACCCACCVAPSRIFGQ